MANVMRLNGAGSSKAKIIKCGSLVNNDRWNDKKVITLNVKSVIPNDWNKVTINNFILPSISHSFYSGGAEGGGWSSVSGSYNNGTGDLTVTFTRWNANGQGYKINYPVFCVLGAVERL